jgi:glycosyltransferase involved in cell wall biosynthesis
VNILVLTAYAPVLHVHGGGVRMFHNIRLLSTRHNVRVVSFIEAEEEREMLRSLEPYCESVAAVRRVPDFRPHWLSVRPFLAREFSTPEMDRLVDAEFRKSRIDVLQCEYLQMAQFHRKGVFSVLTLHEMLSANAYDAFRRARDPGQKLKLFYRWMQMLRYEVLMSAKFDRVVTMTVQDREYLRSYRPNADIRPIPIGIDPDEFAPSPEEPSRPLEVLFVGNFRHSPNVEAAEFLLEQMAPRFSGIQFRLPGSYVTDSLRIKAGANVSFPGYISDTRVLYRRPNTIVAAPLFSGSGQRVKLLEAFSMACPVITTSVGAFGFPVQHGREALIADTPENFAESIRQLILSEPLRRDLGRNAREMILSGFDWAKIRGDLLKVVEERGSTEDFRK